MSTEGQAEPSRSRPPPGSSKPKRQRTPRNDLFRQLAALHLTLKTFLGVIDEDAQLLDSSSRDGHEMAESIRTLANQRVFCTAGPLDSSVYQENHKAFEGARAAENDGYEVYADALESYQGRRGRGLGVADSTSDKSALVDQRRKYISTLSAFEAQVSAILDYLRERSSSS